MVVSTSRNTSGSDGHGARSVSVEAVFKNADIGFHEIPRHDYPVAARDSVDHLVVQRNAEMPRESHVLVEARLDTVTFTVVNDKIVDLARRHSGDDRIGADVANLRSHAARFAHAVDLRFALDVDFHVPETVTSRP